MGSPPSFPKEIVLRTVSVGVEALCLTKNFWRQRDRTERPRHHAIDHHSQVDVVIGQANKVCGTELRKELSLQNFRVRETYLEGRFRTTGSLHSARGVLYLDEGIGYPKRYFSPEEGKTA